MLKRSWFLAMTLGALVGLAGFGQAQKSDPRVIVQVPFAFYVEGHLYPAGEYSFAARPNLVELGRADGAPQGRFLANAVEHSQPAKHGQVIFQCRGSQCFLYQVWIGGHEQGQELTVPKREKELREKRDPAVYLAYLDESRKR